MSVLLTPMHPIHLVITYYGMQLLLYIDCDDGVRFCPFWLCMDALKEKNSLEELLASGKVLWKIWQ
jgi:hypothetical protein